MSNLSIYEAVRQPPKEALKEIQAGRLKGKSDINPMWRLKALTEQFGPCGIGWKYVITKQWLETGAKDEIAAFVNIELFIKVDGAWSDSIPGTGGSSFVANERNGLYTSDECFKMALTDAISVSCKALGFAADVYWNSDRSKYDKPAAAPAQQQRPQTARVPQGAPEGMPLGNLDTPPISNLATDAQVKKMFAMQRSRGIPDSEIRAQIAGMGKTSSKELTKADINKVFEWIEKYSVEVSA